MRSRDFPARDLPARRARGGLALCFRAPLAAVTLGFALAGPFSMPVRAETAVATGAVGTLSGLMRLDDHFRIIAEEGAAHGKSIEDSMFPGRGGSVWAAEVARIYDAAALQGRFDAAFSAALAANPDAVAAAAAFFGSDLGKRITALEVEARRALLDEAVTEAAEVQAEKMAAARDPRLRLIRQLIEAGNMVEQNATSSMTGYLAFNTGLESALPENRRTPAEDLMTGIWGQEAQMRADATDWLVTYMVLAYGPLSDDELRAYIAFMQTDAAKAVNAAIFAAYDAAFSPALKELGFEAGRTLQGRDI